MLWIYATYGYISFPEVVLIGQIINSSRSPIQIGKLCIMTAPNEPCSLAQIPIFWALLAKEGGCVGRRIFWDVSTNSSLEDDVL